MKNCRVVFLLFLCTTYQGSLGFIDEFLGALNGIKDHAVRVITDKVFYTTYGLCTGISGLVVGVTYFNFITNHGKIAGEKTNHFVRNALLDAGFTKEQVDSIEIRESKGFYSFRNIIFVPFSDEDLARAQQYYALQDDTEEFKTETCKKEIDDLKRKLAIKTQGITDRDVKIYRQFIGGVTKDSIPFWKGVLIHEMSHITHHDSERGIAFKLGFVPPVFAYCVTLLNRLIPGRSWLDLKSQELEALIVAYSAIGHFASLPLGKHMERRSDQELIDRAQEADLLKAPAEAFEVHAKINGLDNSLTRLMYELIDEHPTSDRRAAYLRKAVKELEEKQKMLQVS